MKNLQSCILFICMVVLFTQCKKKDDCATCQQQCVKISVYDDYYDTTPNTIIPYCGTSSQINTFKAGISSSYSGKFVTSESTDPKEEKACGDDAKATYTVAGYTCN